MIKSRRRLTVPGAPPVYTKFEISSRILDITKANHIGCYFNFLPKEIITKIIEECDFLSLYMFFKTCKKSQLMIKENIKSFIDLLQIIKIRIVYI
jgi:hypothetical protein